MPPQPSTVRTGPLGQAGGALSSAAEGFIIADALNEQKKQRNANTIKAGINAFKSGNTDLALSIFQGAGNQGRAITEHLLAGPEGSIAPLDDVSGAALNELLNVKQGRELAIEELIARGPQPKEKLFGQTVQAPDTSIQRQVQTRAGREDAGVEGLISGPQAPRTKLLQSIQATQDDELVRARATAKEERTVATEQRAARGEVFGQRLAEVGERRLQGAAALAAQREKRLTIAQNNALRMAIADQRSAQSLARLKLTKDRVDDQKAFFSQIADDADANKKLNNAQVRAGVIPTQNASAPALLQELNRIAFKQGRDILRKQLPPFPGGRAGAVALPPPREFVQRSIDQGALTPEMQKAVALEFPQNSQAAIRAFNKTIESIRASDFSREALGDQRTLQQISAALAAIKGRPSEERQAEIDLILVLLAQSTGLPIDALSGNSAKGKSIKQFVNDFVEGAGFAGVPVGGLPALISGISNILFDGQTTTAPAPAVAPRSRATAPSLSQVEQDEAEFFVP